MCLSSEPDMWRLIKMVIPKIEAEWENVAYSMGYDPSTVNAIDKGCNGRLDTCCQKLFSDWLATGRGCTPKTWQKLLERIGDVDNLAAAVEKISGNFCMFLVDIIVLSLNTLLDL